MSGETKTQEDDFPTFTGCLACLNDGISLPMIAVSYAACLVLICCAGFITYLVPKYGGPFLALCVCFCAAWSVFLHMYRDENPALKKAKEPAKDEATARKDD